MRMALTEDDGDDCCAGLTQALRPTPTPASDAARRSKRRRRDRCTRRADCRAEKAPRQDGTRQASTFPPRHQREHRIGQGRDQGHRQNHRAPAKAEATTAKAAFSPPRLQRPKAPTPRQGKRQSAAATADVVEGRAVADKPASKAQRAVCSKPAKGCVLSRGDKQAD